jgi:methionyl-tRNA formyltransferase
MTHRVVFMGTPRFALPTLRTLVEICRVVGVVTQPERPSGRGRQPQLSPVQVLAEKYGLPVSTPISLKGTDTMQQLCAWQPEVIVVAAFGMLLPPAVLDLPPAGCVNVHASLLPRWRGAAPVAAAILNGDDETGVTLMKMDVGLDTGPIIRQVSVTIGPDDTRETLTECLGQLGADLLRQALPDWLAGRIQPRLQDDSLATYAPPLRKEQGYINWQSPADRITRQVRAFHPWPGTFTRWRGKLLKILRAVVLPETETGIGENDRLPGTVILSPRGPVVVAGRGHILLVEVQPPGKRPMTAADFARGARGFVGSQLG